MICKSCAMGADVLSEASTRTNIDWARACHAACEGKTHCDCQHKVDAQVAGKAVQKK